MLLLSMILLGTVIGFVGAGGAGVTIALLHMGFGVPMHTALAVALASMTFTMLSGALSHFREHEVVVKTSTVIGGSGVIGALAGAFGIGAAAYIQIALMVIFGIPLLQSIGTCMMVILPISASGGLGYLVSGHLDVWIFLNTLAGLTAGAWVGAQMTHLAPPAVLKASIAVLPALGGSIMLIFR